MADYKILPLSVSNKEAFTEASREELRVLLALIEAKGETEELSRLASVSAARCRSALVLWEEAGVIEAVGDADRAPTITDEFEERLRRGEIRDVSSKDTAESIRNHKLADMIAECAVFMKRSALGTEEIKDLTALYEQYALSEEYIVTLAAYLAAEGRLTVTKLVNKAIKLAEKDIDTPEALAEYIESMAADCEAEREFRKIFGIYGRALSKTEKETFARWGKKYGYFTEIVGEAYDIAVNSVTRGHVKYADKILTHWYESGCRTLAECRSKYESDLAEKKAERAATSEKNTAYPKKAAAKPKERYGDFDINEAFLKALERSYGKEENN